jgi:hypothetical protein
MKTAIYSLALVFVFAGIASAQSPTFNKDIAPILYQNCVTCHRPGEVAPFSLLTYDDAVKRASLIAAVTKARYMPPWKAEPGPHFQNERRLTDQQIGLIQAWVNNKTPEGDPATKPKPPVFRQGWQLGEPDKVFSLSEQYAVPTEGPDQFRCFVIPLNLDRDVYIKSSEFRPGNSRVVHHAIVFTDPTGASQKLAKGSDNYPCLGGPGFVETGLIGGWTPGSVPFAPPAGMTSRIRKGTNLVLQIHYHPSGKRELDQSSIGIQFGDAPTVAGDALILSSWGIDIPAGESRYVVRSSLTVPSDVEANGIIPHAHYLAKEMNITAHAPDGSSRPLIAIKDWDFNWQGTYLYQTPIKLAKGTRIEMEYTYDNSENNPRNPSNPPKRVRFGEQSTDEMAFAFILVRLPSMEAGPAFQTEMRLEVLNQFLVSGSMNNLPPEFAPVADTLRMGFALFDGDRDGKLDDQERKAFVDMTRTLMK